MAYKAPCFFACRRAYARAARTRSPLVIAEEYGMLDALAPGTDAMTAAALRRGVDVNEGFPQQLSELMGFLGDNFPTGHPYKDVHAVPGPWQAKQTRVADRETTPELWILSSSTYFAHLVARLGRSYAFALQFGNADLETAMRIYREEFKPSEVLDSPYSMAMLCVLPRASFVSFSPEEVEAYPATANEQNIIDMYVNRTIAGTAETVADQLEQLQAHTGVDEMMMVLGTHTPGVDAHGLELLADHYNLS